MPLVWIAHKQGYKQTGKISGKDFMDAVFSASVENGYSHYFYGSTAETIGQIQLRLKEKYPGISILGAVSPPFQKIEEFDIDALAEKINELSPTFFWCGLGAPKQEFLISRLQEKLASTFSVGVGLAFEYYGGTVRRAPLWMRNAGLEWLYRLSQQPKNIPRAVKPFLWVMKHLLLTRSQK
jgi:N-acetylglucosaminyldiphosphoundecaprenol N-acetyl-beta-D-mannosaminyltransferase